MKNGIFDYWESNPVSEPPAEPKQEGKSYAEMQAEKEEAERLKESISAQIQQGSAPEYVLYTAIRAIGLLSSDAEWSEANLTALDSVYDDLRQESFAVDNAAIAKARLDEMRAKYTAKVMRQINTQLKGCRELTEALTEAYRIANQMEQQAEQEADQK